MIYYEGSGIAGHEIGHSLGRELGFATTKHLTGGGNWQTKYIGCDVGKTMVLDLDIAEGVTTQDYDITNVGYVNQLTDGVQVNGSSGSYILYGFANAYHNEDGKLIGNKECGTYIGTGASGNKVTTLGKPAEIIIKSIKEVGNWLKWSNKTSFDQDVRLNTSDIASDYLWVTDPTANEFVLNVNSGTDVFNTDQEQYLYIVSYDTKLNGGGAVQEVPSTTSNIQIDCVVNKKDGINSKNVEISQMLDTSGVTDSGEYYIVEVN
jgi:hypothetical protein